MNTDEARAYIAEANRLRPFGLSWEIIAKMQGGKIRKASTSRANGRPCHRCGKPSGSVGLLPTCPKCLKTKEAA